MKEQISITLDKKLLRQIDRERGITDRSSFIEDKLSEDLNGNTKSS
jgi:metal-responsive CopG/Arc/MetJ family transcriptional regulator